MDFGFSEDQELLRKSAADFLAKECPMTYVRQMMEDERGYSDELWNKMAELGWMGLIYPEEFGGAGLNMVDLVVILEEMGRAVLPGPFFSTVCMGGLAILEAGNSEQKQKFLPSIASGKTKATLAVLEENARWDEKGVKLSARKSKKGYTLNGIKLFVPDAHVADIIVCAGHTSDGISLFLLDRQQAGVSTTLLKTMDQTRKLCEVRFAKVQVGPDAVLGTPGEGWKALSRVLDRSKVALCAEMCGGAQKVLDMSVEYAKMREQFGRPIGSFQAIQHKCANMLVQVESAKSATYYAAWAVANDVPEAPLAAAMAKAYCSDAYRQVSAEGIQVHGGIGFTWEHDMHIYFKRAKGSEVTFGDAAWNRELVAQYTLDVAPATELPAV
jgi:alkylation response protein AidB-like acyl-CoA dehydrogenase